jgi:hypothetical protein
MGGRGPYRHGQTIHCNLPAGKVVEMNLYYSGRVHVHRTTATALVGGREPGRSTCQPVAYEPVHAACTH